MADEEMREFCAASDKKINRLIQQKFCDDRELKASYANVITKMDKLAKKSSGQVRRLSSHVAMF